MAERHESFPWTAMPFGVVSLVMFGLSYHEARRAKQLQQAHCLSSVSDAMRLSKFLPILIAVRGKTGSNDPLHTKITNSPAVMIEDTSEWNALKQNDKGVWVPDSEIFSHNRNESKWFITNNDGDNPLRIESCANASHLEKTLVTSKQFVEGETNTYKKLINRLSGYQPVGIWQTEKSLPIDTAVTVVGELTKSHDGDDGSLLVRRPSSNFKGKPFYITTQTFEELQESIITNTVVYKWMGIGFGTIGLILVGINLWKHIKSSIKYRRIRKQIEEGMRRRIDQLAEIEDQMMSQSTNVDAEHHRNCIVCWDNPADAVFIPCGHICTCLTCSKELATCPVCRNRCSVYKIYLP
eukprot:g144.t1